MTTQCLLGRFYLAAQTITVNATPVVTTAGYYYLAGYTGESPNQLDDHLGGLIAGVVAGSGIGIDLATGLTYIAMPGAATITWGTATTLRDLLGFSGADTGSTELAISSDPCRYLWAPKRNSAAVALRSYANGLTAASFWDRPSMSMTHRAPSGASSTIAAPFTAGVNELSWQRLDKTSVRVTANPTPNTFEQFWLDTINGGQEMRVVLDASSYTSANTVSALARSEDDGYGDFSSYANRSQDDFDLHWDVRIPLVESA